MTANDRTFNILAALEATPSRGRNRCALAQWLDAIPADAPGREELIRLVETPHDRSGNSDTRSGQNVAMVLTQLGYTVTANPVLDHRGRACGCYRP